LVDDAAMAALNRTYRGIAEPTDVLAFPMTEGPFSELAPECLGDVVISVETAVRQKRGGDLHAELALLLVHGILHLVGYDHGTARERQRMGNAEAAVLGACGVAVRAEWAKAPRGR
jgi:probable rRNA maturation factor